MSTTVATGQVASSAGTIFTPGETSRISALFHNTSGSSSETVTVTIKDSAGNSFRVAKSVLAANECLIIRDLTIQNGTVLQAVATDASTVDYMVSNGPLPHLESIDSNGALKQSNSGVTGNQTLTGSTTTVGLINSATETLTPGASTAAAGSTTTDAGVLPAGTSKLYPTTAADGTKGVRVHASDKVTGRLLLIGNGVSNAILKVYAPSGGTINGGSADAAFSSASGKGVIIVCLSGSGNTWLAW